MIFTERTIRVTGGASQINSPIVLYKGDKNIKIRFKIVNCPYTYSKNVDNIIEVSEASYAQLVIKTPNNGIPIFSDIAETESGYVTFTITGEMIDEAEEVGKYSFQVRLLDSEQFSRITIPEVVDGIEVRDPIAIEGVSATNEVGEATVGYALTTAGTAEDAFDTQGNYNKTTWQTGNRITAEKLNKIEAGIDGVNQKVASGGTGGQGITPEQAQQLNTAYQHSQTAHVQTSDIPTKTSDLTNDSDYVNSTYVTNKIAEAQLGGGSGSVDLSGYVTKETGNASQITFSDGQTFQAKLDAGILKGEKGDQGVQGPVGSKGDKGDKGDMGPQGAAGADGLTTAIFVNGNTYTHVDGVITLPDYVNNGIVNENGGKKIKIWAGTKVEYDALLVKDEDTVYLIEGAGGTSTPATTYTITNNLTNCTNSNTATNVDENSSYTASISANDGYTLSTVTVTMGGADITSTAYSNGSIFIESVTGDVIITCTAIQNSGGTDNIPEAIYTLGNQLTLDGTGLGVVDTGYGLFDTDRDFTIFIDFTPDGDIVVNDSNQQTVFKVKQNESPWIGVDITLWNQNGNVENPCVTRGNLISTAAGAKKGIFLSKMSTGVASTTNNRQKFIIKRVASEQKMYFYDSQGLIGSYNDSGSVASNLFNDHVIIGAGDLYFKGVVHDFRLWYKTLTNEDITTLLS